MLVLLILFLAASGVLLFYGMPRYVRKNAEKAYEQSVLNGYSLLWLGAGVSRPIGEGRKKPDDDFLRENAAYIETRDMMILLGAEYPGHRSDRPLSDPGECGRGCRAVLPGVPLQRQRLTGRMIPLADRPISAPEERGTEEQETEIFALDVDYTKEEFVKIVTDTALRILSEGFADLQRIGAARGPDFRPDERTGRRHCVFFC